MSEKSGNEFEFFRKAIPVMPRALAIICCIFNIFFPGLGKYLNKKLPRKKSCFF